MDSITLRIWTHGLRNSIDTALMDAAKEIAERMQTIETDIARIRVARESEANDRRKLRREVVTYYEGYVNNVNKHKTNLERKISMHHEHTGNILFKEEVQLGKNVNYIIVLLIMFLFFRAIQNGPKITLRPDSEALKS